MAFISEVLEHIERIYNPLNLANMKSQKLKCVRNTAPENQRVLNFTCNPYWRMFLFVSLSHYSHNIRLIRAHKASGKLCF